MSTSSAYRCGRLPCSRAGCLGVRPADLTGTAVVLDDLWGRSAARLRERLGESPTWRDRFALIDALLARRCAARPPADPAVVWAWNQIVASGGRVRVDGLATELGWSRKRLWSRFHAHLGMAPKHAAKLVRFDHAVHRMVAGHGAARVAADSGYCDQSHLHRDVRAFAGATPAAVVDEPFLTVDARAWPTGPPVRRGPAQRR